MVLDLCGCTPQTIYGSLQKHVTECLRTAFASSLFSVAGWNEMQEANKLSQNRVQVGALEKTI